MNPSVRAESNPPVFGRERELVKARAAVDYHARALAAAAAGDLRTRAKRAQAISRLDQQVAQAEVEYVAAQDRYDEAVRLLASLEGDT